MQSAQLDLALPSAAEAGGAGLVQGASPQMQSQDHFSNGSAGTAIEEVYVSREELNRIVMNFLVLEGHKEGALTFQRESGLQAEEIDLDLIDARVSIKAKILEGDIEGATRAINDLNPEILETRSSLYFKLRKQQLIELIKRGEAEEAIRFAQNKIAPKCVKKETPSEHQRELELVMALLMFEDTTKIQTKKLRDLVNSSSLKQLASEVNRAILEAHGHCADLRINFYWQLLQWAHSQQTETDSRTEQVLREVQEASGGVADH